MIHERPTYAPGPQRPVLLALGCRGALLARCREAAACLPIDLEAVDLLAVAGTAGARRPLALLVAADLYAFDPEELDALAQSVGARRVLVEEAEPLARLAARLAQAVTEASAAREAEQALPPRAAPARNGRRSGIRWVHWPEGRRSA